MRPNQQSKRSRGRSNSNRKNTNPLSRSYESNGPDVRIRGNAQTIADKYAQLARDAHSAGDSVAAENYLQHAEHYNRIILSAQAQQQARFEDNDQRADSGSDDDGDDDDDAVGMVARSNSSQGDSDNAEPAGKADDAASDEGDEADKSEAAPRRERRPRRRTRSSESADDQSSGGTDPSKAPQPSLSDLPSFVTNGADAPAE